MSAEPIEPKLSDQRIVAAHKVIEAKLRVIEAAVTYGRASRQLHKHMAETKWSWRDAERVLNMEVENLLVQLDVEAILSGVAPEAIPSVKPTVPAQPEESSAF